MPSRKLSDQEEFWKGQFGLAYTDRNSTANYFTNNAQALSIEIKNMKRPIARALELGANRGLNIEALKFLLPITEFTAVEINTYAAEILEKTRAKVFNQSIIVDIILGPPFFINIDTACLECSVIIKM